MGLKDNLKTPLGRLQWMLEIIKASLDKRPRDDVLILDCLFALMCVVEWGWERKGIGMAGWSV